LANTTATDSEGLVRGCYGTETIAEQGTPEIPATSARLRAATVVVAPETGKSPLFLAATPEIEQPLVEGRQVNLVFSRQSTVHGIAKLTSEIWVSDDLIRWSVETHVGFNDHTIQFHCSTLCSPW
jgi:hypothetical protein